MQQIIPLDALAAVPYPGQSPDDRPYVNHLAWNPSGDRLLMFNRWYGNGRQMYLLDIKTTVRA